MKKDIFIFGEVLFDIFESGEEKLGGAPFNVAWHLKGFGLDPIFISSIGYDVRGEKVISLMNKWQLKTIGVKKIKSYQTGVVNVYIDRKGPTFEIPYNQAFDHISFEYNKIKLQTETSIPFLYHGSLALRSEDNLNTINNIKYLLNPKIFIDINLRSPWWESSKLQPLINDADYLKLNNYEIFDLFHTNITKESLQQICEKYNLECIILTKGEEGASIFTKNGDFLHSRKELDEKLIDTVGAGDAFAAVSIYGLLNNWDYKKILKCTVDFAAYVCTIRGALPDNINIYNKFLDKWDKIEQ
jgi:fructokinase